MCLTIQLQSVLQIQCSKHLQSNYKVSYKSNAQNTNYKVSYEHYKIVVRGKKCRVNRFILQLA